MENSPPILFDRARLRKRRVRSATTLAAHDFLHREAAERMADSLAFITHPFATVVELGAQTDALATLVSTRRGTTHYIACDLAPHPNAHIVADEEKLPFTDNSVDAVLSVLSLQWVNDLPGTLAQIHRMLKPDGLFMAVMPGGETLRELRSILASTETARSGGVSPRVAPFIDVRDAGALLQRAGFALPVADSDPLTITYPHLFALMNDLRGAGHCNMLVQQPQHFTPRSFFMDAAKRYLETHSNPEGEIVVTAELVTLTGWKPSANQQQPARRGSGTVSLTQALQ